MEPALRTGAGLLSMQRLAGNQAVRHAIETEGGQRGRDDRPCQATTGTVEVASEGVTHPVALTMARADVRARLPTFNDLRAVYTDRKLRIPEREIQERVAQLLGRMRQENRLKSKDSVATIIAKIFPGPGRIDQTEFDNAVDAADRTVIYQSVLDAETAVKPPDQARLKTAMKDAADLIRRVEADPAGLKAVFGKRHATAKARYASARVALGQLAANMDVQVSTDYNLDDPETSLGGWASHETRHMHLLLDVVKVVDPNETAATLIHEAAHLAHGSVDDHGYYGSAGFEAMTERQKVGNAAHYEELPRRLLGTSSYAQITFKPGKSRSGGALSWDDTVHRHASEYLRKAWNAALDIHLFLRDVRKEVVRGGADPMAGDRDFILQVSRVLNLTIHEQDAAHATVTQLDVTLTESIARGMAQLWPIADAEPVPDGPYSAEGASAVIVETATSKYGQLLGDPAKDKALLAYLVAYDGS